MTALRVCTFDHRGERRPGLMLDDGVLALARGYAALDSRAVAPATLLDFIRDLARQLPLAEAMAARLQRGEAVLRSAVLPMSEIKLTAPLLYPGKMFCAGGNYYDHKKEMHATPQTRPFPADPYFFVKPADNTVIATGDPILIPRDCEALDWEVELGLVIGRRCKGVSLADALDCVAGYTVFVDMTARDLSRRTTGEFFPDWVSGKCFDNASPMGPCILLRRPGDGFEDFHMRLLVNDKVKQDADTSGMIVKVDRQVSWLSQAVTLNPGDVIATGTPHGVGFPLKDFLKPGDLVRAEIDGIGTLVNKVVRPPVS